MKITFILPSVARFPTGGHKVVYEYANHLSDRGHSVTVVHPALEDTSVSWPKKAYHATRYALRGITHQYGPEPWFKLRPAVHVRWVPSLRDAHIPLADAVIATGWPTAEHVASYSPARGRKFYLLQSYESWWGPEPRVRATWQLPLHKIVIARWLEKIAAEMGESASYIPNGLDFQAFGCDVPVRERRRPQIAMLYHEDDIKGSTDGLKAMEIARRTVPDLTATLFGVYPPPENLPNWASYVRKPPQTRLRAIYNEATVFLGPSWTEGWPLPPAEAMMSGAALVCTDIGGHQEYAVHERNALLAPARAPEALGAALLRALTDHALRQSLAETALDDISRFTWTTAVDRFEAVLANTSPKDV